jgi:predicted ATPase
MTEDSPFYQVLKAIEKSQHVDDTELTNRTESETRSFVADVLNVDKEIITPLSDMVYNKAQGNFVFAKQGDRRNVQKRLNAFRQKR